MVQLPGKAAGDFKEAMVDRAQLHCHGPIQPWGLPSTETGHATNHWEPFSFQGQCR